VVRQSRHARDEPCLAAGAEAPAVLQLRSSGISRELALHIYVRQRPRVSTTMMRSRDSLRRSALTAPATTATIAIRRSIQPPRISGGREAGSVGTSPQGSSIPASTESTGRLPQALAHCAAARYRQLGQHTLRMVPGRVRADRQRLRQLTIRQPLREQPRDSDLLAGQLEARPDLLVRRESIHFLEHHDDRRHARVLLWQDTAPYAVCGLRQTDLTHDLRAPAAHRAK